jgi:hypothetical protein
MAGTTPGRPGVRPRGLRIFDVQLERFGAAPPRGPASSEVGGAGGGGAGAETSQAHGSTGCLLLETAAGATDPTMEQGPGVPASRERRVKDERAGAVVTPGVLSAEGKLRRAGTRSGEIGFATDSNAANPRVGSRMKQACEPEEEQAVAVVRNHEDGTREGVATLSEGRASAREWTLSAMSTEGRSLDNPRRGNPALRCRVARTGRCRESRHEGQEGRAPIHESGGARTDRGPLEGRDARASQGRGGRWRRPTNHDFDRVFPPRDASRRAGCRARTLQRCRKTRQPDGAAPWREGGGFAERRARP